MLFDMHSLHCSYGHLTGVPTIYPLANEATQFRRRLFRLSGKSVRHQTLDYLDHDYRSYLRLFKTLLMMNPSMEQWGSSVAEFIGVRVMIFVLVFPVLVIPWYTLAYRWKAMPTIIVMAVCDLPVLILITLFMVTGGRGDLSNRCCSFNLVLAYPCSSPPLSSAGAVSG